MGAARQSAGAFDLQRGASRRRFVVKRVESVASSRGDSRPEGRLSSRSVQGQLRFSHEVRPVVIQKNWQALIKPKQLAVEHGDDPKRVATAVAEPLERGFGLTLGNALRRVLLSSLQGAAITAVQIEGVLHEFSSMPGVLEDVTDIVLNIKGIGLRMHGEGPKRMRLRASGPGEVRASAIET